MNVILTSVIVLGGIGLLAAFLLYAAARKFYVHEDPRIGEIEEMLPGANCGACGQSGCHAFAVACASADSLENLTCPGGGQEVMERIAGMLGLAAGKIEEKVAVVACNGTCANREPRNTYMGVRSCTIEAGYYGGESGCVYGCLGGGDCVAVCPHDAISIDPDTGLPAVDFDRCVGCGKCADACPRHLIDIVPHSRAKALVHVACRNHDKGGEAMKECAVSCIGCGKCKRACPADAITLEAFCAGIDASRCVGCGKCVEECPRGSILYNGILHPEAAKA